MYVYQKNFGENGIAAICVVTFERNSRFFPEVCFLKINALIQSSQAEVYFFYSYPTENTSD